MAARRYFAVGFDTEAIELSSDVGADTPPGARRLRSIRSTDSEYADEQASVGFRWALAALSRTPLGVSGLLLLVAGIAAVHLSLIRAAPGVVFIGDERGYLQMAHEDAYLERSSLLPGTLRFAHRPPLASRVYAQFDHGTSGWRDSLFTRVRHLHVLLLMGILVCLYVQGRLVGLGSLAALPAPLLLGLFPWFGLYVHALWPEILHAFCMTLSFTFLIAHVTSRKIWPLVPGALFFSYAMLTRGTLNSFAYALVPVLFLAPYASRGLRRDAARAWYREGLVAALLFVAVLMAVLGPQLIRNWAHGYGVSIAANTWRNVEYGLRRRAPSDPDGMPGVPTYQEAKSEYNRSDLGGGATPSLKYREREKLARARTLEFVRSLPVATHLRRQTEKYVDLFTQQLSFMERFSRNRKRWSDADSKAVGAWTPLARLWWYCTLGLGALGLLRFSFRNPRFAFLSIYVVYYLAALYVVSWKVRFCMQLLPALCVLGGAFVSEMVASAAGRKVIPVAPWVRGVTASVAICGFSLVVVLTTLGAAEGAGTGFLSEDGTSEVRALSIEQDIEAQAGLVVSGESASTHVETRQILYKIAVPRKGQYRLHARVTTNPLENPLEDPLESHIEDPNEKGTMFATAGETQPVRLTLARETLGWQWIEGERALDLHSGTQALLLHIRSPMRIDRFRLRPAP